MTSTQLGAPSTADYCNALTEVSFLLDILAATVDDLMGGATVSVGRISGRHQARRLPIYVEQPTLESVVSALQEFGQLGAEFGLVAADSSLEFRHCAIRRVCQSRQIELGGNLCKLYHYYLDGVLNEFLLRPTRSRLTVTGPKCRAMLEVM